MSFEGYTAEQLRAWADHECGPWCMKPYESEAHEIRTNLARYAVKALEYLATTNQARDRDIRIATLVEAAQLMCLDCGEGTVPLVTQRYTMRDNPHVTHDRGDCFFPCRAEPIVLRLVEMWGENQ